MNLRLLKADPVIGRGVHLYSGVGGDRGGGTADHADCVSGPHPRGPPCHQDEHVAAVDVSVTPRHRYPVVKAGIHIIRPHLIFRICCQWKRQIFYNQYIQCHVTSRDQTLHLWQRFDLYLIRRTARYFKWDKNKIDQLSVFLLTRFDDKCLFVYCGR